MTTPSKVTSPRRKTKSVSQSKPIKLTPRMISDHSVNQAIKEIHYIIDNWTDAERKIIGHVCPLDPVNGLKEIRRLLGESIARCKVIPFPAGGKRGAQISQEA